MSWEEELFDYLDDLEGQAAALYAVDRAPDLADRSRAEYRSVTLAARVMASVDRDLTLEVAGLGAVSGRLVRAGTGWGLLRGPGQEWLVRLDAVTALHGCSERAVPEVAWPVAARVGLAGALRRLSEAAQPCSLHLTDGRRHDGVLLRVGGDFVELATGAAGRLVLVALAHVAAVQSREG